MLDVGKLATLRAVVAHGSFSAAGHAIGLTQPAVSRQVSVLERQLGTQLVRRTQHGVHATEAGRVLVDHADAVLARLALAEAQVADLAGLRAGHVRLGSFFTALVYLSAEMAALLEAGHPDLFRGQGDVIADELVDRPTAFRRLAAAELDVAIVFEHSFEPDPPPEGIELIALFEDPPCVLVMVAHRLNVLVEPERIAVVALKGAPVRHVQAAIMRGQRAPAARAVIDALVEVGRGRAASAAV